MIIGLFSRGEQKIYSPIFELLYFRRKIVFDTSIAPCKMPLWPPWVKNRKFSDFFEITLEMFSMLNYICQNEILTKKNFLGVLDRLENSKNARKIGVLSF